MKKLLVLLALAAAAIGLFGYARGWFTPKDAAGAKSKNPTAVAASGPIRLSVSATGRVVSQLDVDIKCKASGVLLKLPFDVSDRVKKGDLLVELDPVDEQRAVKLAQAGLTSSEAHLAQAKQNLLIAEKNLQTEKAKQAASLRSAQARAQRARIKSNRIKEARTMDAASMEDADTAETEAVEADAALDTVRVRLDELKTQELALELRRQDIKLAEAQAESDRVSLANAQQRLADTRVLAPMDGVVSARGVQVGQIISSGVTNVGGGTTMLTLSDLSRMFVLATVDESNIGKVALDQTVILTADAFPGQTFPGKVVRKATKGQNVSNVVTFEVKIEVTGKRVRLLMPEMTTNLEIVVEEKENVVWVPAEAVFRKQGKRLVQVVLPEGATEEREVETGIQDGVKVEIAAGLKQGETVEIRKGEADSKWRGDSNRPGFNPIRVLGGPGGGGGGRR